MPEIVACIAAYSELEMLMFSYPSIYSVVDKILFVEGAIEGYADTVHSVDSTVSYVMDNDVDKKVILIQRDTYWKSLEEQKNQFCNYMENGQWMFIVDADEIHNSVDIEHARQAINTNVFVTEYTPVLLEFYKNLKYIIVPTPNMVNRPDEKYVHNFNAQRFFLFRNGMHFSCHHPTACDALHMDTFLNFPYVDRRTVVQNWYIYHLGMTKPYGVILNKKRFYNKKLYGMNDVDALARAKESMQEQESVLSDRIVRFTGTIPDHLKGYYGIRAELQCDKTWLDVPEYRDGTVPRLVDAISGKVFL